MSLLTIESAASIQLHMCATDLLIVNGIKIKMKNLAQPYLIIGDGSKHDTNIVIFLRVQLVRPPSLKKLEQVNNGNSF